MRNVNSLHDPEGYVIYQGNELVRVMADSYIPTYNRLMSLGLYHCLTEKGYLIKHEELNYNTIKPELIPLITYADEWTFNQLKHSALLTLRIQQLALEYGMSLKDASTNNVQFINNMQRFIDTSSFEIYEEGQAWQAYSQFCEEFLIPLALASYVSLECLKWRGASLKLASKIIPKRHFISGLGMHIFLHSLAGHKKTLPKNTFISKVGLEAIISSLYNTVRKLPVPKDKTLWDDYYDETINYTIPDYQIKKLFIENVLHVYKPNKVIDLGCNRGLYTEIMSENVPYVLALDNDYQSVDVLYKRHFYNVLPLVADLFNPTPDSGWMNSERMSLLKRLTDYKFDMAFALALVHHLCLKGSIPLEQIATLFSKLGNYLVVEFVPENDPQIIEMTRTLKTHHPYGKVMFLDAFRKFYKVIQYQELTDSKRVLYLMRKIDE